MSKMVTKSLQKQLEHANEQDAQGVKVMQGIIIANKEVKNIPRSVHQSIHDITKLEIRLVRYWGFFVANLQQCEL
jgi:hypothetical protein